MGSMARRKDRRSLLGAEVATAKMRVVCEVLDGDLDERSGQPPEHRRVRVLVFTPLADTEQAKGVGVTQHSWVDAVRLDQLAISRANKRRIVAIQSEKLRAFRQTQRLNSGSPDSAGHVEPQRRRKVRRRIEVRQRQGYRAGSNRVGETLSNCALMRIAA